MLQKTTEFALRLPQTKTFKSIICINYLQVISDNDSLHKTLYKILRSRTQVRKLNNNNTYAVHPVSFLINSPNELICCLEDLHDAIGNYKVNIHYKLDLAKILEFSSQIRTRF